MGLTFQAVAADVRRKIPTPNTGRQMYTEMGLVFQAVTADVRRKIPTPNTGRQMCTGMGITFRRRGRKYQTDEIRTPKAVAA